MRLYAFIYVCMVVCIQSYDRRNHPYVYTLSKRQISLQRCRYQTAKIGFMWSLWYTSITIFINSYYLMNMSLDYYFPIRTHNRRHWIILLLWRLLFLLHLPAGYCLKTLASVEDQEDMSLHSMPLSLISINNCSLKGQNWSLATTILHHGRQMFF